MWDQDDPFLKTLKPSYPERLEELLKDKKLTKKELAEMIHTSPQTISKACSGIRLTQATAEDIVNLFPEYNLAWVLGQDNAPKYVADIDPDWEQKLIAMLHKDSSDPEMIAFNEETIYILGLDMVCRGLGYEVDRGHSPDDPITFRNKDGTELVLTSEEFEEFTEDLYLFLKLRLNRFMKKGRQQ